jgi:hypothetical protein
MPHPPADAGSLSLSHALSKAESNQAGLGQADILERAGTDGARPFPVLVARDISHTRRGAHLVRMPVKVLAFSGKLTGRATGRLDFEIPASLQ